MNATLLTGAVVLGGWILPEVGVPELQGSPNLSVPAFRVAASELHGGAIQAPGRAAPASPAQPGASPYQPRAQAPATSPSHAARQQMPPVPTAPDAGMHRGPAFPTHPGHMGPQFPGTAGGMPGTAQMPNPPTGAVGMPMHNRHRMPQPAQIGTGALGGAGVGGSIVKPFSDYRQLPVVSPFLHLERPEGLDFDNYNTLVRPFVEQHHQNQQFRNEFQIIQENLQRQQRNLQQLHRETELYRVPTAPRPFQDTGDFFPMP